MDYALSLPYKHAVELFKKAQEEDTKEYFYRWWLARYPLYTEENYESFKEFYEKMNPPSVEYDKRSKDEIMNEILGFEIKGKEE